MAGHSSLTFADHLAIRRIHLRHPELSKTNIAKRLGKSRASIYRVIDGVTRKKSTPDGAFPELRAAYIRESGDPTEIGWAHVWIASLEAENDLLNAALD